MKVILSRKGFDGTNGGIPSPIMPDGTPLSMPIPSDDENVYDELSFRGISYTQILHDLRPAKTYSACHMDPDIDGNRRIHRLPDWKPAFGQIDAAQSYLINTVGIGPGDVFLFFGNFRFIEEVSGHFRYVRNHADFCHCHDIQLIWGYMQVGTILSDPKAIAEYFWHPHSSERRLQNKLNALYLPKEHLSFDETMPGYGILPFRQDRVLTMKDRNKGTWKENPVYMPDAIIGNRKNSAKDAGVFYSGIWQELGLRECPAAEQWMRSIVSAKQACLCPTSFDAL